MNRIRITIAIPVYNVAKHMDVMLDSLQHQTMASSEFEIICVNDGSTDNSKEVIMNYQQRMGNIVLIDRATNSGSPVFPRNDAIEAARGEYILFLDSDDFLGEEALERFYHAAKENESDVVFGRYVSVNSRGVAYLPFTNGNRYKADLIADHLLYAIAPHKMFRHAFLKEHGFKFDPKAIAGNEDQLFVIQCYVAARVVTVLADYSYYFFTARGDENLSAKYVQAEKWMYVWHRVLEFLNEHIHDEAYKRKIKAVILNRLPAGTRFETFLLTSRTTREQKQEWLQAARRFVDLYIDDDLIESAAPRFRLFWRAVKENDIEQVERLALQKRPTGGRTLNYVKIKRAGVVSFKRPSVQGLLATTYAKAGTVIQVYPTITGWFETRWTADDGTQYAAFIRRNDVRYTGKYLVLLILKRISTLRQIKSRMVRLLKK